MEESGFGFGGDSGGHEESSWRELLAEEKESIDGSRFGEFAFNYDGPFFALVVGGGIAGTAGVGADSGGGDGDDF